MLIVKAINQLLWLVYPHK